MISIKDRYFSLNRTLLLIVGLWPYNKSKFARLQIICCFSVLITSIIFQISPVNYYLQFTTFMTSKCTADLLSKILSFALVIIGLTIKCNSFYINSGGICDNLKDKNEIATIERYERNAKRYTARLTMLLGIFVFMLTSIQLWPDFQNIFLSVNKSQAHRLQIETEYFIDQERYFYLLLLHINISFYVGLFITLATGTMLIACFQYICGMFKIASYRMENAMKIYTMSQFINLQNKNLICKGIVYAVDIHRKAIKYSLYLISSFEMSFMLLIIVGVIALSLNILRIASKFNIEELIVPLISTICCFLYMFLANLVGQEITNHYNLLFVAAYNVRWYMAPLYIQRLILLLLQRSNKTFGLNIGRLFVASLQGFATLANASISYFTVMYSMQ